MAVIQNLLNSQTAGQVLFSLRVYRELFMLYAVARDVVEHEGQA
jgi:hypothetical protein